MAQKLNFVTESPNVTKKHRQTVCLLVFVIRPIMIIINNFNSTELTFWVWIVNIEG